MKIQYLVLTMPQGDVLAMHLPTNGKVGAALNNTRVGNDKDSLPDTGKKR